MVASSSTNRAEDKTMGLRVLLVDDSPLMRKMVSRALRQAALDIDSTSEAGNGIEALAALENETFDLVILRLEHAGDERSRVRQALQGQVLDSDHDAHGPRGP